MHAIRHTHARTLATSLIHVKIARATYCTGHWDKENERTKTSNLIVDHFSLIFVNLSLA